MSGFPAKLKFTQTQQKFLESRGITDLSTLLHTYPYRYYRITPADTWQEGDEVLFTGLLRQIKDIRRISNGRILCRIIVSSWNRDLEVSVFSYGYAPSFKTDALITVCGQYHETDQVSAIWTSTKPLEGGKNLYPVYTLPAKTRRDTMIRLMDKALPFASSIPDRVPPFLRERHQLPDQARALRMVHQPESLEELSRGLQALKYEEFLCFHTVRMMQSEKYPRPGRIFDQSRIEDKLSMLPYTLTADQRKSLDEILADMRGEFAMYRLLQGEVGCGKTVVGAMALYACVLSGLQGALLAPTEILARQHLATLSSFGIDATLYCSSLKASEKRRVLEGLKNGTISLVVGTHSLFSDPVEFDRLGLVIADEQQRFGVLQRRALIEKGTHPDVLLMSATPIPRTAAHFCYGDISLSAIRTLPPGRKPFLTKTIFSKSMKPVLDRVMEAIDQENRQVYVICPAVEKNEETTLHSVKEIHAGMNSVLGSRYSIGLLHGGMKTEEKEAAMQAFKDKKIQILVATTVVEVGIDVPDATVMVIYDSDRFGLSTLHQLRGRVARGQKQGECYLLSSTKNPQAKERLRMMEKITDGFELSAFDLRMRGPGDLLGTRQSGLPAFILGSEEEDLDLIEACLSDAREVLEHPEWPDNRVLMAYAREACQSGSYLD